eukprot:Hpha_TRINITY_DN10981_c0_g1::TRINITY_DN10981_c0_g1_i1::g.26854::m.26854/K08794/CAMK1; calcium/calmodulin-dependent protein kinase I
MGRDLFNIGDMLEAHNNHRESFECEDYEVKSAAQAARDVHEAFLIDLESPPLGKGAFGVVRLCRKRESGEEFAVKCIDKGKLHGSALEALHSEVEIMTQVRHFNVVRMVDFFETAEFFYIVMELVTGGPLVDAITPKEPCAEETVRQIARSLLVAVDYLHSQGIVHRDLKPANLLLARPGQIHEIKITDFGFARLVGSDGFLHSATGTHSFMAPEVIKGEQYGVEVDMWSVGVILFMLLCGRMPFRGGGSSGELSRAICSGEVPFTAPAWESVSAGAKKLVAACLIVPREQRITAKDALLSSWIRGTPEQRDSLPPSPSEEEMPEVAPAKTREKCESGSLIWDWTVDKAWFTELDLTRTPLPWAAGDEPGEDERREVVAVASMLRANTTLRKLLMAGNRLDDDACEMLAEAAEGHPTLRRMDMTRNDRIGERGGRALLKLARGGSLTEVLLDSPTVPHELLHVLQKQCKDNVHALKTARQAQRGNAHSAGGTRRGGTPGPDRALRGTGPRPPSGGRGDRAGRRPPSRNDSSDTLPSLDGRVGGAAHGRFSPTPGEHQLRPSRTPPNTGLDPLDSAPPQIDGRKPKAGDRRAKPRPRRAGDIH